MLKWGIIGTGSIAHTFARGLEVSKTNTLVAVGSRSIETAQKFGQEFDLESHNCFGSYADLFNCAHVDIVYISTPHPQHYELALQAAQHKKHMLVEKPIAMNEKQVRDVIKHAKEHDVFFMEAYMYRCHPQTLEVVDMIKNGDIGQVKFIRANFCFDGRGLGAESRIWRNELGGGAIMDIGGYPLSFVRLIAGIANGSSAVDPVVIKAVGYIQPDTKVDEWSNASIQFENGITAQLFTGIFSDSDCSVEILGSEGSIKVNNLWRPDLVQLGPVEIEYVKYGNSEKIMPVQLKETNLYTIEADAVAEAISQGKKECKYMTWDDTLGQVHAMDAWRKEIGLKYQEDE